MTVVLDNRHIRSFDPNPRTDVRYAGRFKAAYDYLNEPNRSDAAWVRLGDRAWLARYPADQRREPVRMVAGIGDHDEWV